MHLKPEKRGMQGKECRVHVKIFLRAGLKKNEGYHELKMCCIFLNWSLRYLISTMFDETLNPLDN